LKETLAHKAKSDASLGAKIADLDKALAGLDGFLRTVRSFMALAESVAPGDDLGQLPKQAKDIEQEAHHHGDGIKLMTRRLKALL